MVKKKSLKNSSKKLVKKNWSKIGQKIHQNLHIKLKKAEMGKNGKSQTNKQNLVLRSFARPQDDGKLKKS